MLITAEELVERRLWENLCYLRCMDVGSLTEAMIGDGFELSETEVSTLGLMD